MNFFLVYLGVVGLGFWVSFFMGFGQKLSVEIVNLLRWGGGVFLIYNRLRIFIPCHTFWCIFKIRYQIIILKPTHLHSDLYI